MEYNITYGSATPGQSLVTLAMAKTNSHIEWDSEDDYFQLLLDAVVSETETYIGQPVLERTAVMEMSGFKKTMRMPLWPVSVINSITYIDVTGMQQTLPSDDYKLQKGQGYCVLEILDPLPSVDVSESFPVTVNMMAGWAPEDVPGDIKRAVLMRFSHSHLFREDVPTSYNRSFYSVLRPYRKY